MLQPILQAPIQTEWTRLPSRGPLWNLEHFSGKAAEEGSSANTPLRKRVTPKKLGLWLTVTWPVHDGRISHRADGKTTVRKFLAESDLLSSHFTAPGDAGSWLLPSDQADRVLQWLPEEGTPIRVHKLTMSPGELFWLQKWEDSSRSFTAIIWVPYHFGAN